MRQLFISCISAVWLTACGGGFADITGSVDGKSVGGSSAFWGGPHIVFLDSEMDCDQLGWVDFSYRIGSDELSTEATFNALLFTYESAEVQDGKLTIAATNSPATGWFIASDRGTADTFRSTTGSIDSTMEDDWLSGTFEVNFGDDGSLNGEFEIEKCENLKPRR